MQPFRGVAQFEAQRQTEYNVGEGLQSEGKGHYGRLAHLLALSFIFVGLDVVIDHEHIGGFAVLITKNSAGFHCYAPTIGKTAEKIWAANLDSTYFLRLPNGDVLQPIQWRFGARRVHIDHRNGAGSSSVSRFGSRTRRDHYPVQLQQREIALILGGLQVRIEWNHGGAACDA